MPVRVHACKVGPNQFTMEKLDRILESYVAKGETAGKDELLGAAFVVVNQEGETS